jgi:hypothetical protein
MHLEEVSVALSLSTMICILFHGQWVRVNAQETSNYRELSNLINAIKKANSEGLLMFTDLFVAESTVFKGTFSSKRLFEFIDLFVAESTFYKGTFFL